MHRLTRVCIWFVWLAVCSAAHPAASVPNLTVTGPIPANAKPGDPSHDYPFFATTVPLAEKGYIEEEFYFEGTANRYSTPAGATGAIIDTGHPYRSRMIVRRPISPDGFNGTVLMEWLNVTGRYDFDGLWIASSEHLIRRGYAWVGVSAQPAGIHDPTSGLKVWSPGRYGTLDVTENGRVADSSLAFDIFSQAAQAIRRPDDIASRFDRPRGRRGWETGIDPLGGLPVKYVFAIGVSQSANALVIYHNSIHPMAGVVDGFIMVGTSSPALLRTDLDVKVFKLVSETDLAMFGQAANRQPDSDRFRRWEAAGVAHLDFHEAQELAPLQVRDLGIDPSTPPGCDLPPFSRIPGYYGLNAAYDHMVRWVAQNIAPPSAPEIALMTAGPPVVVARDAHGNALGGIRLPQHAVPIATNTGVNSGPGSCRLYGSFQPFDAPTIEALYPGYDV